MRTRNIKKQFWLNDEENQKLRKKARVTGLSEADLLRFLINDFLPKEKPSQEFYEAIKQLRAIGNNLNQIAKKANSLNLINEEYYMIETDKLNQFIVQIKAKYLLPEKRKK
ncbi:MAG TPA: plasmid mobilization relaxosome protein MobC [Candidatus Caccenecus avistercoris]|nr:plasmid mobilization relaxosome protein MobC [Candidatus Caccenecus avistercoris]